MARVHVDRELRDGRGVRPGVCVRGAAVGWRRGRDGAEEGEGARGREWNNVRGEERETRGSCCFFCNLSFSERLKALFREVPGRRGGRQGGVGGAAVREGARSREAERGGSKIFFLESRSFISHTISVFLRRICLCRSFFSLAKGGSFFCLLLSLSISLSNCRRALLAQRERLARRSRPERGRERVQRKKKRGHRRHFDVRSLRSLKATSFACLVPRAARSFFRSFVACGGVSVDGFEPIAEAFRGPRIP